jgi:hypothetical protein
VDTEGGCLGVVLGTNLVLWRSWGKNHEKHKTWWLAARLRFGPGTFHLQVRRFPCYHLSQLAPSPPPAYTGMAKGVSKLSTRPTVRHFNCVVCVSGLIIFKFTHAPRVSVTTQANRASTLGGRILEAGCSPFLTVY